MTVSPLELESTVDTVRDLRRISISHNLNIALSLAQFNLNCQIWYVLLVPQRTKYEMIMFIAPVFFSFHILIIDQTTAISSANILSLNSLNQKPSTSKPAPSIIPNHLSPPKFPASFVSDNPRPHQLSIISPNICLQNQPFLVSQLSYHPPNSHSPPSSTASIFWPGILT